MRLLVEVTTYVSWNLKNNDLLYSEFKGTQIIVSM